MQEIHNKDSILRYPKYKYHCAHYAEGKCRNCGKETKNWGDFCKVFEKVGWFRGDDELMDCLCADCFKNHYKLAKGL